jgi:hypothetical protein
LRLQTWVAITFGAIPFAAMPSPVSTNYAIEAVIKAADPAKREALSRTIDAYAEDFPEDFFWATGSQAPMLLHDSACRPEAQSKPRPAIRLVDRKPEGNA